MDKKKQLKLISKGWAVGDASDFLGLSKEETEFVELKVSLAQELQKKRQKKHMTQESLSQLIHSSQSRIAKMEKSDSSVSLDLMIRSLLALGTSRTEISKAIARKSSHIPATALIHPRKKLKTGPTTNAGIGDRKAVYRDF
jgi:transcriptional regulator with XRE-family HTH domain